jgi:hypothetical protein
MKLPEITKQGYIYSYKSPIPIPRSLRIALEMVDEIAKATKE